MFYGNRVIRFFQTCDSEASVLQKCLFITIGSPSAVCGPAIAEGVFCFRTIRSIKGIVIIAWPLTWGYWPN